MKTIHLVRHGEVYNPSGVLYGRISGFHLSKRGQQMAQKLGDYFAGQKLAAVISSPLERAQETAAPILSSQNLSLRLDERLIEADNKLAGQVFGKNNKAIFDPKNFKYFLNPLRPSWGEPYVDIAARMKQVVEETLGQLSDGEQAVLVSHQLPIWICRLSLEGKRLAHDPRRRQCRVASVTSFIFDNQKMIGISYLEPAHELLGADANRAFSSGA